MPIPEVLDCLYLPNEVVTVVAFPLLPPRLGVVLGNLEGLCYGVLYFLLLMFILNFENLIF